MSKEAAQAFVKKVMEDETLRKKLVTFAAGEGFEFTVEELDEAELDAVSGGAFTGYLKIPDIDGESQLRSLTRQLNYKIDL